MKNAILRDESIFQWENQARQYPEHGSGIIYFKGVMPSGEYVNCLLYYGKDDLLEGILNHYPTDRPPLQKKGSVNIAVRQDKRRHGIATTLLDEAIKLWNINLKNQEYTNMGGRFITNYMRTSIIYKLSRQFRLPKSSISIK